MVGRDENEWYVVDVTNDGGVWAASWGVMDVDDGDNPPYLGAWVTTSSVPIPAAVWILGSGLIGFVGIRRRLNK